MFLQGRAVNCCCNNVDDENGVVLVTGDMRTSDLLPQPAMNSNQAWKVSPTSRQRQQGKNKNELVPNPTDRSLSKSHTAVTPKTYLTPPELAADALSKRTDHYLCST